MNEEFEYLSDEELQKLINETESAGLLQAPPDFEASVMKRRAAETKVLNRLGIRQFCEEDGAIETAGHQKNS